MTTSNAPDVAATDQLHCSNMYAISSVAMSWTALALVWVAKLRIEGDDAMTGRLFIWRNECFWIAMVLTLGSTAAAVTGARKRGETAGRWQTLAHVSLVMLALFALGMATLGSSAGRIE